MTLLFSAEWLRLRRNRSNVVVLLVLLLVLAAGACWSGLAARQYREQAASTLAESQNEEARLLTRAGERSADPVKAAGTTFELARNGAPAAVLPALGGLVLSVNRFQVLNPEIRTGIDPRYLDGRKADAVINPLLEALGMLDFATLVAILLPLATLGLTFGLVQEDREQGNWRLSCAQHRRPWAILAAALLLRWAAIVGVAACASALAFAFDPGADPGALAGWLLLVTAFSAVWIVLAGLFSMLPVSSGAAAVGLLGTWLLTSFALPSLLAHMANQREPMPSRLAAIASMRAIQQQTEVNSDALLRAWYRDHPVAAPASVTVHRFPIAMVPRYLEQDRLYRPLQARFDQARSAQFEALAGWSWSSPGLALIMGADMLAGIDAPRYQRYLQAVDDFEDRWRACLVPVMMGYRQLDAQQLARLPEFVMPAGQSDTIWSFTLRRLWQMAGLVALGAAILCTLRKRFAQP